MLATFVCFSSLLLYSACHDPMPCLCGVVDFQIILHFEKYEKDPIDNIFLVNSFNRRGLGAHDYLQTYHFIFDVRL